MTSEPERRVTLGIKANLSQFILLVVVNALVGAMVGFYALVPLIGQRDFGLTSNLILLSYIFSFGLSKAFCNYYAGRLADTYGRRRLLILGWILGVPVPIIIILAPSWGWIVFANFLLGMNQGFAWSMTVIMKVDLVGPERRGLAMGLNEFAGYLAVSITLLVSGVIAARYALRPEPFYLGLGFAAFGLSLSALKVKETRKYALFEAQKSLNNAKSRDVIADMQAPSSIFRFTTFQDHALSSSCFAGLVNNLIFGMSWGLFPLLYASHGVGVDVINLIKALYPGVWGILQLGTGPLSDKVGRKWLIVAGQLVQAGGLWLTAASSQVPPWMVATALLGIGTALVYPSLLAAVGDVAHPSWRGTALGTYRFWRDIGYAVGAVLGGLLADFYSIPFAIEIIGLLTVLSAGVVAMRMYETRKPTQ